MSKCIIGKASLKIGASEAKDITDCSLNISNDIKETSTREQRGSNKTYGYGSMIDIELSFTLKTKDTAMLATILNAMVQQTELETETSGSSLNISGKMIVSSLNNEQPLDDCETVPVTMKPAGAITISPASSSAE